MEIKEQPRGLNIFTRIQAAAFDVEIASFKKSEETSALQARYAELVGHAKTLQVDQNKLNLAETRGRLQAAIEVGDTKHEKEMRDILETLEQDIKWGKKGRMIPW